jgi:murein DD-endopeptidase MepM/ murein hydrolase activator NlpD
MRKFIKIAIAAAGGIAALLIAAAVFINRPPFAPDAYFVRPAPEAVDNTETAHEPEETISSVGVYVGGEYLFAVAERQDAADAFDTVFTRYLRSVPATETVISAGFNRSIALRPCAEAPITRSAAIEYLLAHPDVCPFTAVTRITHEETGAAFDYETSESGLFFQGTRVVNRLGRDERLLRVTTRAYANGVKGAVAEEVRQQSPALTQQYTLGTYTGRTELNAPPVAIEFARPHAGRVLKKFGVTNGVMNYGVDLAAEEGDTVVAAADGVVRFVGTRGSYGLLVEIDHGDGVVTRYAHCGQGRVRRGQQIAQGDTIALVAGISEDDAWTLFKTPFLHFEVWIDGVRYDPSAYLS